MPFGGECRRVNWKGPSLQAASMPQLACAVPTRLQDLTLQFDMQGQASCRFKQHTSRPGLQTQCTSILLAVILFANHDSTQVVLQSEPYLTALLPSYKKRVCQYCLHTHSKRLTTYCRKDLAYCQLHLPLLTSITVY